MKPFVIACIAAIVIAAFGAMLLESIQRPAQSAYSTTGARV